MSILFPQFENFVQLLPQEFYCFVAHVIMSTIKTKPAVRKMVEPPNKKQKPIFPILKKAPNAIEGPSLTNSQPAKSKSVYLDKKYRGDFTVSKV